jgi:hypothetical protein
MANLTAQLETVHVGEHDVQQQQVRLPLLEGLQGALGPRENPRFIAMPPEVVLDEGSQLRFVFYYGDSLRHDKWV